MQVISNPTQATLLIADNDPTTLETLTESFKGEEYKVIPVPNLEATETLIKLSHDDLDAVILDGRLERESDAKDRSGWDLAQRTKKADPDLVVIMHSRVLPKDSPLAGSQTASPKGSSKIIEVPKSDLPTLIKTVKEEIEKTRLLKQKRSSQDTLRVKDRGGLEAAQKASSEQVSEAEDQAELVAAPIWSKQHKALVGLIALLLALISGLAAVLLGQPKFLVVAVVCTLVAFIFVSLTLE